MVKGRHKARGSGSIDAMLAIKIKSAPGEKADDSRGTPDMQHAHMRYAGLREPRGLAMSHRSHNFVACTPLSHYPVRFVYRFDLVAEA